MRRFVDYGTAKRGMRDALQSIAGGASLFADTRGQVTEAVAVLLRAGAEAGTLRADVEPEDVLSRHGRDLARRRRGRLRRAGDADPPAGSSNGLRYRAG